MKKYCFFFVLLLLSNYSLAQEEIPVKVKADNLKYSENSGIVTASGSVETTLEGIKIFADSLIMDTKTNIVTAEGNVKMVGPEYDGRGSFMTYNVNDDTSFFKNFKTGVVPESKKGKIYLGAQNINNNKSNWIGREGTLTTCDYDLTGNPHYFSAAKKIEYYPNDKMIGRSVTLYLGRVPVFWFPYLEYSLKGKRKNNWTIGHNEVEGDFLKTFWDYPYGVIFLDFTSKKGWGQGFKNPYDLGNKGSGSLYLYHLEEADTGTTDWVEKINHQIKLNPNATLNLKQEYSKLYLIPSGRIDQSVYAIDYAFEKDKLKLSTNADFLDNRAGNQERINFNFNSMEGARNSSYGFTMDQGKTEPRYIRTSQRFSHRQNLFNDKTTFDFNANYSDSIQQVGTPGDQRLDLAYNILSSGSFYTIKLHEDWYLDLDRGGYLGDSTLQYVERQPEINLDFTPIDLKLFNLSSSLAYGFFHEVAYVPGLPTNREFSTGRYSASLKAEKTFPLVLGSNLLLSYGVLQHLYQPGDQLYSAEERVNLSTNLLNLFSNNFDFSRGISEGNSPFLFDRLGTRYSNLRDTVTLRYQNYFNWVISGGYNYESKKYFNIDTTLTYTPHPALSTRFLSGYDIGNKRFLDLQTQATITPVKWLNDEATVLQDLNTGTIKSASNLFGLEIGNADNWISHFYFKLGHVYDSSTQNLRLVDLMIEKDLHCWDMKYSYSDYRKEFAIVFTLKAFPGEPIGYTQSRGFYFDAIEKAMGEIRGEFQGASPQRF